MNILGNPFMNDTEELIKLDTGDVMSDELIKTLRTVEHLGNSQYEEFQKSVLIDGSRLIHEPIKKNSLPLFKCPTIKEKSKQQDKIARLKANISLFFHFFQHENNPFPASLSDRGKLRQ